MERISASFIGELLYKSTDAKLPERLRSKVNDMSEYEIALIEDEVMFLNIFVTDYAVQMEFDSDGDVKNAILKTYYSCWGKMANDMEITDFFDDMKKRFSEYRLALRTPHHLGPIFVVGKTFAKYCGYENDLNIPFIGSVLFTVNSVGKLGLLRDLKKEYEITL